MSKLVCHLSKHNFTKMTTLRSQDLIVAQYDFTLLNQSFSCMQAFETVALYVKRLGWCRVNVQCLADNKCSNSAMEIALMHIGHFMRSNS